MTHTSLAPVETVTAVGQLHAAHIGATLEIDNMIELRVARVLHLEGATYITEAKRPEATEWVRLDPNTICYVCPEGGHGRVEPYVSPASAAIDWTDLGTRIGDRTKPLAVSTMRRIRAGLNMVEAGAFSFTMAHGGRAAPFDVAARSMGTHTTAQTEALAMSGRFVMSVNHDGGNPRAFNPDSRPMPRETAKRGEALLVAAAGNTYDAASRGDTGGYVRAWPAAGSPMPGQATTAQQALITMLRANGRTRGTNEPLPAFSTGRNHGLTVPSGAALANGFPLTNTAAKTSGLVIPFRKGSKPYPAGADPLSTMATRDQHAVMQPSLSVEDCQFRMLQPREAANAQAFPRSYVIHGNQGEQQMQAGNAVAVNVAAWLGAAAAKALGAA